MARLTQEPTERFPWLLAAVLVVIYLGVLYLVGVPR